RQIARQISGTGSSSPTPTPTPLTSPTIPPTPSIPPTPTIPPIGTTPTPTPTPKCSPPSISQTYYAPGSTYRVTMTASNPNDATIFYTTDGSTPIHSG